MTKIIPTYLLRDLEQVIPMDKEEFYEEQVKIFKGTGKPSRAAEVVKVFLFNPNKELMLQKRSGTKQNPGLFDKSIGGHIRFGDTPNYTVQAKTLEELSVPAIVLSGSDDFKKSYRLLKQYLDRSALIQFVDSRVVNIKRLIDSELIEIATKYYFYLGVYSGSIHPDEKDASAIEHYSLGVLSIQMKAYPDQFTNELGFFLTKYSSKISNFLKCLD